MDYTIGSRVGRGTEVREEMGVQEPSKRCRRCKGRIVGRQGDEDRTQVRTKYRGDAQFVAEERSDKRVQSGEVGRSRMCSGDFRSGWNTS